MGVKTEKFIRKPLYVDAVRVTEENFEEIAAWCQGEILTNDSTEWNSGKRYIKVRVHLPKIPRQSMAFAGDWLLYTERGYKVYTNKAFRASFDLVEGDGPNNVVQNTGIITEAQARENAGLPTDGGVEATLERAPVVPGPGEVGELREPVVTSEEVKEQPLQAVPSDSDSAPPPQTEDGRRILTIVEQREMDPEEVQGLLRSGEAILQQDMV